MDIAEAARTVSTTKRHLSAIEASPDPVEAVIRISEGELSEEDIETRRRNVGQLVLGRAAEIAFEDICRAGIDPNEFGLKDYREDRTSTDYRLYDLSDRPLFRFNVKFFGSVFRRGAEMVNLPPSDCFPLATYKIYAAVQKHEAEHLPYVFAVVGVPELNAKSVAEAISDAEIRPLAMLFASKVVTRKRDFEDWLVDRIVQARSPAFTNAYERIRAAEWYVLSARRAEKLLREMLFERVYALRIPAFTRQFGGAEVDMHFSLLHDLVTIKDFLDLLKDAGPGKVTAMLERGTY